MPLEAHGMHYRYSSYSSDGSPSRYDPLLSGGQKHQGMLLSSVLVNANLSSHQVHGESN